MSVTSCIVSPLSCATGFTFSAFFSTASSWVQSSSSWAWGQLGGWLQKTSDPKVITTAVGPVFGALLAIAPFVALCALVGNVLTSLKRSDPAGLLREVVLALPMVILAIFMARPLAVVILQLVDALGSGPSKVAVAALAHLSKIAVTVPTAIPGFGALLLAIGGVLGAVLLWFELIIRNAIMSLLVCLAPVVFAAAIWAPLRRMALRLVETFIAVALTKFIVLVALALGTSEVASGAPTVILTGVAVVTVAIFAPFMLFRVIPLLETSAVHAAEGLRQRATSGARRAAGAASGVASKMMPVDIPGPPERSDDMGLSWWPHVEEMTFPEWDGVPPVPPIDEPYLRGGHVAYHEDEYGPVLGWHFDE